MANNTIRVSGFHSESVAPNSAITQILQIFLARPPTGGHSLKFCKIRVLGNLRETVAGQVVPIKSRADTHLLIKGVGTSAESPTPSVQFGSNVLVRLILSQG